MLLSQLLSPWIKSDCGDCDVLGLQNDSRLVVPGDLFLAYPGAVSDGRLFIDKALSAGAVAIAYDPLQFVMPAGLGVVAIPELSRHLAKIARRFYNNPSQHLNIIGVTGTNGKTTIAYQLAQAHHLLGQKTAYIGTIGQGEFDKLKALNNTTPDALSLLNLLHGYTNQDISCVCMEVSSHALSQHRVDGIEFNQAIFTNLSLDHLDYHHTMEEYAAAKALLFARPELEWAIFNEDDPYTKRMRDELKNHVKSIGYGIKSGEVKAVQWSTSVQGTQIEVTSPWGAYGFNTSMLGQFNVYNSLAIFTALILSGHSPQEVIPLMSKLQAAPGRMEVVASRPYVVVDYAHTPDALTNVLSTLKQFKKGQLWAIFGCGGDRDKSKRPIMGQAASQYADQLIITSDNPRSEDPAVIIDEIVLGIPPGKSCHQFINREEAIAYAIAHALPDDIVLIAGKGHETYQQIGQVKHRFSDQEVVRLLVNHNSK